MLTMRTCHDSTTYKTTGITDWVGSFFTVKPVHAPGTQSLMTLHQLTFLVLLSKDYLE